MTTEEHHVRLTADATSVTKTFADVAGAAAKTAAAVEGAGAKSAAGMQKTAAAASTATASMTKFGSAMSGIDRIASGVIGATLVGVLSEASRAAAEAEASQVRLEQAINNTGAAFESYEPAIQRAIDASVQLGFDDEATADALSNLTQMTGDAAKAMSLIATAQDLARAKGISLAQASTIVGKVASGNVAILQRYGIVVDQNATAEEALAAIQRQNAGQAQRYAQTQAAAIDRLGVAWGNLLEGIGGAAGPLQAILGVLPGVSTAFQAASGAAASLASGGLAKIAGFLNPLTLGIGGVTAAATLATVAFLNWRDGSDKLADSANKLTAALADVSSAQLQEQARAALSTMEELAQAQLNGGDIFLLPGDTEKRLAEQESALADVLNAAQAAGLGIQGFIDDQNAMKAAIANNTIKSGENVAILRDMATVLSNGTAPAIAEMNAILDRAQQANTEAGWDQAAKDLAVLGMRVIDVNDELHKTPAAAQAAGQSIADMADTVASDLTKAVSAIENESDKAIEAVKDSEKAAVEAARNAADETIKAAEKSAAQRTRATEQAGKDAARAAESTANDQIRAAERAEEQVTDAAQRQADAQIEAARKAEEQVVAAAENAADGQIQAAERAEKAAVKAANQQAQGQIRAAESAARDVTRAAQQAANRQIAAADRLEEQATAQAKAKEEAVVAAANREHDALVERANAQADAQIAAAERATERKLALIDRELARANASAVTQANKIITDANDAALKKIQEAEQKYGADSKQYQDAVAAAEKDLAKAQVDAAKEQARLQEEAARQAERDAAKAQRQEEKRVAAIQAQRDAAIEASANKLAAIEEQAHQESLARIAEAAKVAEEMRTTAARNVAAVEREQARKVEQIRREAERNAERAAREAARRTEQVRTDAEARVAAVRETAAANTAATIEAINAQTEKTIQAAARETERVRRDAERNVVAVRRTTAQEVRAIDRETSQIRREQERQVTAVVEEEAKKREDAIAAIEASTSATVENIVLAVAQIDPEIAKVLEAQDIIQKGASGEWEVIINDETAQNLKVITDLFGPDAVQLQADGTVAITVDPTQLNRYLESLNAASDAGRVFARVNVAAVPVGTGGLPRNTRTPGFSNGGVLPASNGRSVLVGEAGPELVTLPAGSRVVASPATRAGMADGGGGVTLVFNGDVYGYDDFRTKVGVAAAEALSAAMPAALANRRRALGVA